MIREKKYSKNIVEAVKTSAYAGEYRNMIFHLVRACYYHDLLDFPTSMQVMENVDVLFERLKQCRENTKSNLGVCHETRKIYNSIYDFPM